MTRAALLQVQTERMARPFRWGVHDCCLWAADCVQAQTGTDPAAGLRGAYADAVGALRLLRNLGGLRVVASRAGEPIAPMAAAEGDVGLIPAGKRACLAVCFGEAWMLAGTHGLVPQPLDRAVAAWRVHRG